MNEMTIESPCVSICQLNDRGTLCIGCYRSRDEIGEWLTASDGRKHEIIKNGEFRAENLANDRP